MIVVRIMRFFNSVRLTAALLFFLVLIFLTGLVVPQKDLLGDVAYEQWKTGKPVLVSFLESCGLTDIYTAPYTITVWGVFFTNLVVVMLHRIGPVWKRCRNMPVPADFGAIRNDRNYATVEGGQLTVAMEKLRKRGFRAISRGGAFFAVRNRYSPIVTVVFHLSFLLVLAGGVVSFYTKFRAEADVAEGETFTGAYRSVRPPKIGGIPVTEFAVEKIEPSYYGGIVPIGLKVYLRTAAGTRIAEINRPYKEGRLSFIVRGIDVAPHFDLYNERGVRIDSISVKLKVLDGGPDSFVVRGYRVDALFYTDVLAEEKTVLSGASGMAQVDKQFTAGRIGRQQREIVHPAFLLTVSTGKRKVSSGLLRPGDGIGFDGYRLVFAGVSYWADFYGGKEYGLGILYAGFAIMSAALVVRFAFPRREIRGIVDNGILHLSGRGEYFPSLFEDEMREIIDGIRSAVTQ